VDWNSYNYTLQTQTTKNFKALLLLFISYFFLLLYSFFIFACIVWAICLSVHPLASRQNLFCPVLQFCWRENVRDNKKDIAFLLAWDKDSYTERFLALLPCTCVLQPELAHLYQTLLLGHLPIVACQFKITIFAPIQWHIKHFQDLGFLPFPFSSCIIIDMLNEERKIEICKMLS
jgi:hypothetical protein